MKFLDRFADRIVRRVAAIITRTSKGILKEIAQLRAEIKNGSKQEGESDGDDESS